MIPWDKLTVQAITQEPQRCVYFMIDIGWPTDVPVNGNLNNGDPANGNPNGDPTNGNHANEDAAVAENGSEDEGNDSECSVQELTEFYIVTDNPDSIDEIYYVMTKFPAAEPMDDESDDDDFFDGENMDQLNINDDDERFADAE